MAYQHPNVSLIKSLDLRDLAAAMTGSGLLPQTMKPLKVSMFGVSTDDIAVSC